MHSEWKVLVEAVAMATVVEASWHCCRYRHFVTNVVIAIVVVVMVQIIGISSMPDMRGS
jgi:hypothetical protein